jgi:hypothetical protein
MAFRTAFIMLCPCNFFCGVNYATQVKINVVYKKILGGKKVNI